MPDWIMQLVGPAAAAVAVYAGIRADLAELRVMSKHAGESADEAHRRIDDLLKSETRKGRA